MRKFTQTEVDAILAGRVAKFSDYDAIKAELAEFKTARDSAVTEAATAHAPTALTEKEGKVI